MSRNGLPSRILPITVIDSQNPVSADADGHRHDEAGEGPRSLGQPAPCYLFVGDAPISEAEIAQEMQHHRAITPEHSRADAARALVVRELLRREVERLGLAAEAEPVGRESAEEAQIRVLLEREIEDRVPSEDDCLRYYEQNRERFHSPDRIRVRHILLGAPADDITGRFNARSEGERLIAELQADPVLFADFAMRHSDCPSKEQAGELGWLERGQSTPEFDRQVFRLRVGLAAFPVESRWGYHVVSVDGIEAGEPLAFDQVRERISDYLELQVRQRELQHYLVELQERYEVRGLDAIEALAA
ncbi:rotamase [Lysobacter concretionis Ko07 = DSM 16239]|uniref:peptidylprolyl isomerase n=1 Tax=Lysobacter concretionis Ko07 = DSM 16239 TaxID=1122185 RepID=A0A0A0EPE4_9GAMM|nr:MULTISPECIES: peptidylprolyl isomerase [Lysobacter]KGM52289.1 rotamase [Lysobacter concretionis Ko07 = DSM 16239]QOD91977.1 peptidylprolyl isomerase [Lysobacter sp. CW239]